jgi:hypothetical protein
MAWGVWLYLSVSGVQCFNLFWNCINVSASATGPLEPAPIKSAGQYHNFWGPSGDDYCTPASNLKWSPSIMCCCFVWRHTNSSDILSRQMGLLQHPTYKSHSKKCDPTRHRNLSLRWAFKLELIVSFFSWIPQADATQLFGSSDIVEEGYDYLPDSFFQVCPCFVAQTALELMSCTHSLQSHLDSMPSQPSTARRVWNVILKQYQSSRMHGSLSTSFHPSFGSACVLLTHISLSFQHPHPNTNDTTKSQQTQHLCTVEVAAVRDKQVCQSLEDTFPSSPFSFQSLFIARWPERDKTM